MGSAKCVVNGHKVIGNRIIIIIVMDDNDVPLWFTQGKTSLIPKPGAFSSDNTRPVTCLNTICKWYTSCLLGPMDEHLKRYGLMQGHQRGAKEGCCGTGDNLLIDRTVCQDSQRGKRNWHGLTYEKLVIAWIMDG